MASPDRWQSEASFADALGAVPRPKSNWPRLTGLAVMRENDANCAALGEYWTTGSASQDFVTFYMAHGIGCGIVMSGSIYRGASGNAGEIGHMLADPNGRPCWCGRRGCLETVASPRAIIDQIVGPRSWPRPAG